jgi:uncharacterized membrane protein YeiH
MVDSNKGKDLISILVLGWVTALGGGTLRDIILQEPVFWIRDSIYFWTALMSSLAGFLFIRLVRKKWMERLIILFDTIGISLFSILVTAHLTTTGYPAYVAVSMGTITAICGGLIRDIISHRPTMFNNTEYYATPIILGCSLYIILHQFGGDNMIIFFISMSFSIAIRLSAVIFDIKFPRWLLLR